MRIRAKILHAAAIAFAGGIVMALAAPAWAAADLRLVEAAANQDWDAVQSLLREGLDANISQPDGATALHWAAHYDDTETADLLIRAGADVNARNDYDATPLSLACDNANAEMVGKLLAAKADPNAAGSFGETALMRCARTGSAAAVRLLLAAGADVHATDNEHGQTALMWAVAQKHAAAAEALIEGGADINARSKGGFTPLLFAARTGDVVSARGLVSAGADVDAVGPKGMTPLLIASASGRQQVGIFLLDQGADPDARDENNATALHYTVLKGLTLLNGVRYANYVSHLFRPSLTELAEALLEHGADPNVQLTRAPATAGDSEDPPVGATPFLLAAATPDPAMMRLLLDGGADPLLATDDNLTPVMAAAGVYRGQDFTDEEKQIALEAVRLAVELGGDVNAAHAGGLRALHGAAVNGADGIVRFLAEQGAELDVRDQYQQTPLSIASGMRLPWIPYGQELGEIIQPSTAELLLALGATPLDTPGYFQPVAEESDAYRINRSQRYDGADPAPQ